MLLLSALIGFTLAMPAASAPAVDRSLLVAIDRTRSDAGLARLRPSPSLRSAAAAHTHEMVTYGFFGHQSRRGTLGQRLPHAYRHVGEILYEGTEPVGAEAIVAAWLASPEHRAILLGRGWREIGVAAERSRGGELVVTVDFGSRG